MDSGPSAAVRSASLANGSSSARQTLLRQLARGGTQITPIVPIPLIDTAQTPLSFHQQGILETLTLYDGLYRAVPFRNQHVELHLRGRLNHEALKWALAQVGARHDALRTTFPAFAQGHRVLIAPDVKVDLPVQDLRSFGTVAALAEIRQRCRAEACRPMDHENGPLIIYRLFQASDDLYVLWLLVDHLLFDGWSFGILLHELEAFYGARTADRAISLPMPVQHAQLVAWEADRFTSGKQAAGLAYWNKQLLEPPAIVELPTDRPRTSPQPFSLGSVDMILDPAIGGAANALGRRLGVSLFAVLYAGYCLFLNAKTAQTDICVVSAMANRARPEARHIIGGLTNGVVLRCPIDLGITFAQLAANAQRLTTDAIVHQDIPLGPLLEQLHPGSDLLRTYFALQNYPIPQVNLPDLEVSYHDVRFGSTLWDLTIALTPHETALSGVICYNSLLFEPLTVDRLMADYAAVLSSAIANPDWPLSAVIESAGS